jgi:hypothetical protein
MLGYRRLRHPNPRNHIANRPFPPIVEQPDNLAPSRLPNRVEHISSSSRSSHAANNIPI